jgi:TonB family protein
MFSGAIHWALFKGMPSGGPSQKSKPPPVRVQIVEKKKAPPPVDVPVAAPATQKPRIPPVAKAKKPKLKSQKTTKKKIQGLSKTPKNTSSQGLATPLGNTLMAPDMGLRPNEPPLPLESGEDLSAEPRLIRSSLVYPQYTEEALDEGLEGTFVVDVYVDEKGQVSSAELGKKIGYGMDQRLLNSAKNLRFQPGQDRVGQPRAAWTRITFRLELP